MILMMLMFIAAQAGVVHISQGMNLDDIGEAESLFLHFDGWWCNTYEHVLLLLLCK